MSGFEAAPDTMLALEVARDPNFGMHDRESINDARAGGQLELRVLFRCSGREF
jgi:hypothetical protein